MSVDGEVGEEGFDSLTQGKTKCRCRCKQGRIQSLEEKAWSGKEKVSLMFDLI